MQLNELMLLLAPLGRVIIGWLGTATADGKIEKFELQKLVVSLLKMALVTYVGLEFLTALGLDVDVFSMTAGTVLFELALDSLKKLLAKLQPKQV